MSWADRYERHGVHALYLHVPFCRQKCAYCDFHSRTVPHGDARLTSYADELAAQVRKVADAGLIAHTKTAYIGGGTPTMLGESLVRLVKVVRAACPELEELSCEANPESLTPDLARALKAAGATRLSLGIQSTNDAELTALGRIHTADEALQALSAARDAGLDVSTDLMCAIPLQTDETWHCSLRDVLAAGATHVSVYPLQIEEDTPLAAQVGEGEPAWNATDIQAERMQAAADLLSQAGLTRYEVASYARPGKECRHNIAYWTGESYLGLGPSAASMLSRNAYLQLRETISALPQPSASTFRIRMREIPAASAHSCADTNALAPAHKKKSHPQLEHRSYMHKVTLELEYLTREQAVAEDLMLAMRRSAGISSDLQSFASHVLGIKAVEHTIDSLSKRELIQWNPQFDAWQPTNQGWLLGNELFAALWDLAPSQETLTQEVTL